MMKAKKSLALFLACTLLLSLALCLGVAAEDAKAEPQGLSTFALVSLIIGGVVLVLVVVLCIVKREKLAETLRAYRSEMKKITWYPWKQVWRNTILVVVIVGVTAAVLGLLDYAFFQAQILLAKIV